MIRDYTLVYQVDTKQATAALAGITSAIANVGQHARASVVDLSAFEAELRQTTTAAAAAAKEARETQAKIWGIGRASVAATADVTALTTAIQSAGVATAGMVPHINTASTGFQGMSQSLGGVLTKWELFGYGVQLAQQFGQYINAARERLQELGEQAIETRDTMRELANLKGAPAPDDAVVADAVVMGLDAGLTPTEALEFLEQFEGSAPTGRDKERIAPAVERPLAIEGMKFGARVKLDARTAGDLTGVLAQYGRIGSVEQGAGMLGRIAFGLNEGRGQLEPLARSLIKTAGAIVDEDGGTVEDLGDLAAILGVASANATPDRAGTQVRNAVKGLRHFKLDSNGKPSDDQTQALTDLGISPELGFIDALRRIVPTLRGADAGGAGADTWLRQHGFDNEDQIQGLVQLSRNMEAVETRLGKSRAMTDGKSVVAANEAFRKNTRTGQARDLKARAAAMDWEVGRGEEVKVMGRMAGVEFMRLQGRLGGLDDKARQWLKDGGGTLPGIGAKPAAISEAEDAFLDHLWGEALRLGVLDKEVEIARRNRIERGYSGREAIDDVQKFGFGSIDSPHLSDIVNRVQKAGGNPFGTAKGVRQRVALSGKNTLQAEAEDAVTAIRLNAAAAGIDLDESFRQRIGRPGDTSVRPTPSQLFNQDEGAWLSRITGDIAQRGKDPFGGDPTISAKFDRLIEEARRTNEALRDRPLDPGGGPIIPGRK